MGVLRKWCNGLTFETHNLEYPVRFWLPLQNDRVSCNDDIKYFCK